MKKLFLLAVLLTSTGCTEKQKEPKEGPSSIKECYDMMVFEMDLFGKINGKKEKIAWVMVGECWIRFTIEHNEIDVLAIRIDGSGKGYYYLRVLDFVNSPTSGKIIDNNFDTSKEIIIKFAYIISGEKNMIEGDDYTYNPNK